MTTFIITVVVDRDDWRFYGNENNMAISISNQAASLGLGIAEVGGGAIVVRFPMYL